MLLAEKIDGRLRAFLALRKAGYLHEFARLKDRELGPFIAREAKTRGMTIDSDAAEALASAAGPDLGRLMQALEQLEIYVGKAGRISRAQVEELVPESRERSVFELTKAIGTGDARRALHLVTNMLAQPRATLAHSGHVAAPASSNLARKRVGRRERAPRRNGRCGGVAALFPRRRADSRSPHVGGGPSPQL